MRAKLYTIERSIGSFKCTKNRCEVCENVNIADSFTSLVAQSTYKINHRLNCHDKCLIYLLTCKQCLKQYLGKLQTPFAKDGTTIKATRGSS